MYYLTTEQSFDSAHFLKDYKGKCSNIHGHRWRVIVHISSEKLNDDIQTRGMITDFSSIKLCLKEICDNLDHSLIYEKNSFSPKTLSALLEDNFRLIEVDFRPTAENLSKYIFDIIKNKNYPVCKVEVYETPNNCAIYEE